jgi:nucleoside-diphosphate-sugar epimerase
MKRVVITGATSFIGCHLINKLSQLDYYIYAIVRPNSKNLSKLEKFTNLETIEVDLDNSELISSKIKSKCDVFFHLAWDGTRGSARDDHDLQYKNYVNSIKTVEVANKLGCSVYIDAGSQAEYGLYNEVITEDTPCLPVTEYGKYKYNFFKDALVLCKKYGMAFKEPRFFSLYGPDDYEETMIISILKKMINNEDCNMTAGIQNWNFLHIDDAVEGIVKLCDTKCADGPYNFGSDDTRQLRKFIETMYTITNSTSKLNFGAIPYPATGMVSIQPNNSKLKKETGWTPKISFEDGIKEIFDRFSGVRKGSGKTK